MLDYLEYGGFDGRVPIIIQRDSGSIFLNCLVLNMAVWREGGTPVAEFQFQF